MKEIGSTLVAVTILLFACARPVATNTELERFWRGQPANQNPLALAGYERSFAKHATVTLIDEMIADLCQHPSDSRFATYISVIYYMPRPATPDHLAALCFSPSAKVKFAAERFTQALSNYGAAKTSNDSSTTETTPEKH